MHFGWVGLKPPEWILSALHIEIYWSDRLWLGPRSPGQQEAAHRHPNSSITRQMAATFITTTTGPYIYIYYTRSLLLPVSRLLRKMEQHRNLKNIFLLLGSYRHERRVLFTQNNHKPKQIYITKINRSEITEVPIYHWCKKKIFFLWSDQSSGSTVQDH